MQKFYDFNYYEIIKKLNAIRHEHENYGEKKISLISNVH